MLAVDVTYCMMELVPWMLVLDVTCSVLVLWMLVVDVTYDGTNAVDASVVLDVTCGGTSAVKYACECYSQKKKQTEEQAKVVGDGIPSIPCRTT